MNASAAADLSSQHPSAGLPDVSVDHGAPLPVGGDGFAFLFRSIGGPVLPTPFGRPGSGLGYAGLEGMGLAVEFDTRMDLTERDPNANHVSVHIQTPADGGFSSYESNDARVVPLNFATMPLRRPRVTSSRKKRILISSKPLVVQISYTPNKKQLKVFVEDLVSPLLVLSDVPPFTGTFQVGFTAATSGPSTDTHEICQWYFEKQEVADTKSAAGTAVGQKQQSLSHDSCDVGFTGDSCTLDLASLASVCLSATSLGCGGCLTHPSGHCQWCASQKRCISNELTTRSFDLIQHKPYCSDPTSIVEDKESELSTTHLHADPASHPPMLTMFPLAPFYSFFAVSFQ